ncbi:MAG: GNAT family N-acetyltransferase [Planctomycetota bacterium]
MRFAEGVGELDPAAWDRLVGPDNPCCTWAFLRAMELDSAIPGAGALPVHATCWRGDELVAAVPLYVKGDGRGEFIYDYAWWRVAAALGERYYPKLLSMAPFTPVPGSRFLVAPGEDRPALIATLLQVIEDWARESKLSGIHFLYLPEDEAALLADCGYLRRLTLQLVWENRGYQSFDDYLERFRHKDRVKIKRDRRRLEEQGLTLVTRRGAELGPEDAAAMRRFYLTTCAEHGTGSDYLGPETWEALFASWGERLVLTGAQRDGAWVGASLCFQHGDTLYGRYWGATERLSGLYFNLAFYAPIELAIASGWQRFYAGAGLSRSKFSRGFDAARIHSAHRLFSPRLSATLERAVAEERRDMELELEELRARSRLKD